MTKDYAGEPPALLNRPSVFRLNIGLSRATYVSLFGPTTADNVAADQHDFSALEKLLPHPVYGRMNWVCILNPSAKTFESLRPLPAEAYDQSVRRISKV